MARWNSTLPLSARHLVNHMTDWKRRSVPVAVLSMAIALAGCAGSAGSGPAATASHGAGANPSASTGAPESAAPSAGSAGPSSSSSPAAPAAILDQEWATAPLVDVSTGQSFRIADHAGKVIILETMAIWCSNCRAQQHDVVSALRELDRDRVVFIVLDVDPNEDAASLARYRTANGFEGSYAVADTAVARALAAEFGDQILNPPATPIVLIGTDGRVTLTPFGHKSRDEIISLARAHGA